MHKTEYFYKIRQSFTMTNNMASSDLRESVILSKIILITDGTIECAVTHGGKRGLAPPDTGSYLLVLLV